MTELLSPFGIRQSEVVFRPVLTPDEQVNSGMKTTEGSAKLL